MGIGWGKVPVDSSRSLDYSAVSWYFSLSQLQTGRIKLNSSEIAKLEYKLGEEKQKGKHFFDFFCILERREGRHISFENVVL